MPLLKPDPTFYPSPNGDGGPAGDAGLCRVDQSTEKGRPDAIGVVDLDPASTGYGSSSVRSDMPNAGDELHHFGWNACSACLCPYAPHPHMERRYLIVPGIGRRASTFWTRNPIRGTRRSSR